MARTRKPELEAARRTLVTDAAMRLLASGSWKSMTLAAVAVKAGVSKGVVTYWYPSKDALIVAAIDRHHERYRRALSAIVETPGDVESLLSALVQAILPSQEEVANEVAFQAEVWSYAKEHPHVRDEITASYRWFREVSGALLALGSEGVAAPLIAPENLLRLAHALIDGLSIHVAYDPEVDLPEVRAVLLRQLRTWFELDAS